MRVFAWCVCGCVLVILVGCVRARQPQERHVQKDDCESRATCAAGKNADTYAVANQYNLNKKKKSIHRIGLMQSDVYHQKADM